MKSSPDQADIRSQVAGDDGIIRGADISGVVFCTPTGMIQDPSSVEKQEKENIKALEDYWYKKGFSEGESKGFDEGYQTGLTEGKKTGDQAGFERGLLEGEKKGLEKGLENGYNKSREETDAAVSAVGLLAEKVQGETVHLYEALRSDIITLATEIAKAVIRQELKNQDSYRKLIEELLVQMEPIVTDDAIRIVLSPDDYSLIQAFLNDLKTPSSKELDLLLVRNPLLSQGDIRIETGLGLINFDVERQVQEIEKNLLQAEPENEGEVHEAQPRPGD